MTMKAHHLINERNQLEQCPYCNNKLTDNKWSDQIHFRLNYKETHCDSCGKDIRFGTHTLSSGSKKNNTLEDKVDER